MNADTLLRTETKEQLRARMLQVREALPISAGIKLSERICTRLLELPELGQLQHILAYCPTKNEVDPSRALQSLQAAGATIAYPRVDPQHRLLSIHHVPSPQHLSELYWGIHQPSANASLVADEIIDLVLLPALACDEYGHRLGYGQGYYDRLLLRLPNALRIALVYDFQLVPELPHLSHDVPVDIVVSEQRSLHVPRHSALQS